MGPRPAHLNLGSGRADAFDPPKMLGHRDLPSPRAGEIPPALSPLDAFVTQSRMLARKFEEEKQNGRRMSRLTPVMVQKEMENRPGYFRSLSDESLMGDLAETQEEASPVPAQSRTYQESPEKERPISHYPTFDRTSGVSIPDQDVPAVSTPFFDANEHPHTVAAQPDYFGVSVPRSSSPEPVDPTIVNVQAPSPAVPSLTNSIDTIGSHPRTMTDDSQGSQRSQPSQTLERRLVPPQSPRYPKTSRSVQSIRSVPPDSGDEDVQSTSGYAISSSRKFSGSSNMSRPQSPFSPWMQPIHRSPSMTSEYSINGSQRPTPNFSNPYNFSRPMSSAGSRPSFDTRPSFESRPSLDTRRDAPHRYPSAASSSNGHSSRPAMSREGSGDDIHDLITPGLEPSSSDFFRPPATPGGQSNSSYIYAKYALPRGRPLDRDSKAFRDSWIQSQFDWDRKHNEAHKQHERYRSDGGRMPQQHERNRSDGGRMQASPRASPATSDQPRMGRELLAHSGSSEIRSRSADPRALERQAAMHRSSPSVKTDSTDRTIKATPLHQKSASVDLTPEEHLEIGIACHDSGETNKSTYHLRLAAIAGLPTGMLLYALACRHGWGMRPNQEEGVKWLRKAIETSGLDVADAEGTLNATSGKAMTDAAERRKRKAQYALAIYELGISSMNGWGCSKDKALAVRCYEIAGSWGDADALTEAGFCYTSGVGVKKDLKKAAALYRKAADLGMSMAGNSWIYKPKYLDDSACKTTPEKGEREKPKRQDTAISTKDKEKDGERTPGRSRARSIWGRSKKDKEPLPTMPATRPLLADE